MRKRKKKQSDVVIPTSVKEMGAAAMSKPVVRDGGIEMTRLADGNVFRIVHRNAREGGATHLLNVTPDTLDLYFRRGMITKDQHLAGETLRSIHTVAFSSGVSQVNYSGIHGCSNVADNWRMPASQAEAMRDWVKITDMLGHPSGLIVRKIIGEGVGVEAAARLALCHRHTCRRHFLAALDTLARFFRIGGRRAAR